MPLSQCRYVTVQKYQWWNCRQNPFTKLTLIYGSQDASLDIRNGLHTVRWFSGAPKRQLPSTKLQIRSSRWAIPSWNASAHSMWYHKSLSPADSQCGLYQRYSRWWLQSQHRIDGSEITHACWWSCLLLHKPLRLQQFPLEQVFWTNVLQGPDAFVPTSCISCHLWCWNSLSKSLRLPGVTWWIWRFNCSFALCRSASDHVVAACRTLFRLTWNFLHFDVVTFSAPFTWSSIVARVLWIFCSRNWWNSLANSSSTSAIADFDIFCSRKAPFSL